MDASPDIVEIEVDKLYRSHFGKLLSFLLRFSDDIDLESAEDMVQDSFSAALVSWKKDGLPDNPAAWLYKVSRNRALNNIKGSKKFNKKAGMEIEVGGLEGIVGEDGRGQLEKDRKSVPIEDDQLALLFACA